MNRRILFAAFVTIALGACESGGKSAPNAAEEKAPSEASATGNGTNPADALGGCPFRETSDWHGSIENGRLWVNGRVDLLMAGFKPQLTPRPGAAPGTVALDLALVQDPDTAIAERAEYERRGSPVFRRAEIWCGGERIAAFEVVLID